jgi:hypothetical protein
MHSAVRVHGRVGGGRRRADAVGRFQQRPDGPKPFATEGGAESHP